jgi:hypothetical protein
MSFETQASINSFGGKLLKLQHKARPTLDEGIVSSSLTDHVF